MMEGWKEYRLGDISSKIQYGYTESAVKENIGPKFLRITDIVNETIDWNNVPHCPINEKDFEKYKLKKGDIVVARTGNTTGYAKLIRNDVNAVFASYLIKFEINTDIAISEFVGRLIESDIFKGYVWSIIGGSAQPGANAKFLSSFKILLPPLPTQRKIAKILSAYDDLIENNLKRIKLLEEMAQITYEEWFVRMKFPGHETAKFDKETGLPEGWEMVKLGEVANLNTQSLKNEFNEDILYIDIAGVSPNRIDTKKRYKYSEAPGRAKRIVKHGDIIWSCVRPNRKSHAVIWKPEKNLIASTGFCVISPETLPTSYLYQFLTTEKYVGYLSNLAGGAAYPAVKPIHFKESEITIPDDELVLKYDRIYDNNLELAWNLTTQNQRLKEARDILLPRLITGMIDPEEVSGQVVEKLEIEL